jgi:hypothetical protein
MRARTHTAGNHLSRLASTPLPPRSGVHTRTLHMCRHRDIDTHPRPVGVELPIRQRPRGPCSLLAISFPRVLLRARVGARRLWAGQIYHCDVSLPSHSTCHVPGPEVVYVIVKLLWAWAWAQFIQSNRPRGSVSNFGGGSEP